MEPPDAVALLSPEPVVARMERQPLAAALVLLLGRVLVAEVGRARALLLQGWPLVERMPRPLAVDVDLFTRGGLAILDRIERRGFDVLTARPEVSKGAKLGLLARAMVGQVVGRRPRPGCLAQAPADLSTLAREARP